MRLLGAEVRGVISGSTTLKDAINEAMRDWVTNVRTTLLPPRQRARRASLSHHGARLPSRASAAKSKQQILEKEGRLPDRHHRLRRRRLQRHRRILRVPPRRQVGSSASKPAAAARRSASTPPASAAALPASCRAPIPTCCRMRTARSRRRTPSPPASTTPPSAPSTPRCTTPAAPNTPRSDDAATLERSRQARAHRRHPARARKRARRRRMHPHRAHFAPHDILVVNLSGRGDKDMGILARELHIQGAEQHRRTLMPIRFDHKPGLVVYLTAGDPDLRGHARHCARRH